MAEYVAIAVLGLMVGSFLNVCIWRIPRGQSVVVPSSKCPSCGTPIRPWHNVPVVSYLLLRAKCASCGQKISARYPLVEALNGLFYVLVLARFGIGWHLPFHLAFVSSLIAITFIDIDFQIIPDRISLPWVPAGLLAGSLLLPDPCARDIMLGWKASFAGAAGGFGLFYAIALISRGGMGGGDIKMMAMNGAVLGWKGVLLTTFIGSLLGSALGVFLILKMGKGRKTKVPFGPFLAAGAVVTLFFGQEIVGWYLNVGR